MTKRLFLLVAVAWFSLLGQAETYTHYSEWMAASEMKRTPHPYNLNFSSWWPQWSYQVGVELDPMLDVYLEYGDTKLWNYLKEYLTSTMYVPDISSSVCTSKRLPTRNL